VYFLWKDLRFFNKKYTLALKKPFRRAIFERSEKEASNYQIISSTHLNTARLGVLKTVVGVVFELFSPNVATVFSKKRPKNGFL
jgi:hypothetical protein